MEASKFLIILILVTFMFVDLGKTFSIGNGLKGLKQSGTNNENGDDDYEYDENEESEDEDDYQYGGDGEYLEAREKRSSNSDSQTILSDLNSRIIEALSNLAHNNEYIEASGKRKLPDLDLTNHHVQKRTKRSPENISDSTENNSTDDLPKIEDQVEPKQKHQLAQTLQKIYQLPEARPTLPTGPLGPIHLQLLQRARPIFKKKKLQDTALIELLKRMASPKPQGLQARKLKILGVLRKKMNLPLPPKVNLTQGPERRFKPPRDDLIHAILEAIRNGSPALRTETAEYEYPILSGGGYYDYDGDDYMDNAYDDTYAAGGPPDMLKRMPKRIKRQADYEYAPGVDDYDDDGNNYIDNDYDYFSPGGPSDVPTKRSKRIKRQAGVLPESDELDYYDLTDPDSATLSELNIDEDENFDIMEHENPEGLGVHDLNIYEGPRAEFPATEIRTIEHQRKKRSYETHLKPLGGKPFGPLGKEEEADREFGSAFNTDPSEISWEEPTMLDNCWAQAMLASSNGYSPSCHTDGSFTAKQCYLQRCWCVNRDGSPQILNTDTRFYYFTKGIMLECTQNP